MTTPIDQIREVIATYMKTVDKGDMEKTLQSLLLTVSPQVPARKDRVYSRQKQITFLMDLVYRFENITEADKIRDIYLKNQN